MRVLLLSLSLLMPYLAYADGEYELTINYESRPPYQYLVNDKLVGAFVTPIDKALQAAGIRTRWEDIPMKRQLQRVKANIEPVCLVGRYKNPEREAYSVYSKPYYRDAPHLVLARSDNPKLKNMNSFQDLLNSPALSLQIKAGYTYGTALDEMIAHAKLRVDVPTTENETILRKIYSRHGDMMLIEEPEANWLILHLKLSRDDFVMLNFPDMPAGELRYLMCSKNVDPQLLEKINALLPSVK